MTCVMCLHFGLQEEDIKADHTNVNSTIMCTYTYHQLVDLHVTYAYTSYYY